MENVVLFGASNGGQKAYNALKDQYNITCYTDNDQNKWGKTMNNKQVIPPEQLKQMQNTKVVISSMYDNEIGSQLNNMGITNYEVFDTKH